MGLFRKPNISRMFIEQLGPGGEFLPERIRHTETMAIRPLLYSTKCKSFRSRFIIDLRLMKPQHRKVEDMSEEKEAGIKPRSLREAPKAVGRARQPSRGNPRFCARLWN